MTVPDEIEDELFRWLSPQRRTAVVDVGANPIAGQPPYRPLLAARLCAVVGFEPQADALAKLRARAGPLETYLPDALGDGGRHTLYDCAAAGMTGLLAPDPASLALFRPFDEFGKVVGEHALETRRLDDVAAVTELDYLKLDVQGFELAILEGARARLARAVAVQTEVSFVPLYRGQPALGAIDLELRAQGFVPHAFADVKRWILAPMCVGGDLRRPLNQLLEADLVYVRDFRRLDLFSPEQLKHLALIAHHCYGSFDLALLCLGELERRGALVDVRPRYLRIAQAASAASLSLAVPA
jgi:FkbM family methyltransferase